jgi:hypothetical protein
VISTPPPPMMTMPVVTAQTFTTAAEMKNNTAFEPSSRHAARTRTIQNRQMTTQL